MIGKAWQRRVRIAAMRRLVTNSPQTAGAEPGQISVQDEGSGGGGARQDYRFGSAMGHACRK